jgi:hypothetical protein
MPKTKVFRSRISSTQAHSRLPSRRLSRPIQIVKKEQTEFEGRFLSRDERQIGQPAQDSASDSHSQSQMKPEDPAQSAMSLRSYACISAYGA